MTASALFLTLSCKKHKDVHVEDVTISHSVAALAPDQTIQLTAIIAPDNAADQTLIWESNATGVATVVDGLVTAISTGYATITVTTADGNKTASCNITVTPKQMTMATAMTTGAVKLSLAGAGDVSVNWGDGSITSYTLLLNDTIGFSHNYSEAYNSTIKITGDNITYLYCGRNQLTSLNVGKNTTLHALYCFSNQLTSLNVEECAALRYLNCCDNKLTSLKLNVGLFSLSCSTNKLLSNLNLNENVALRGLFYNETGLKSLDISNNVKLYILSCESNNMTDTQLNNLFGMLNNNIQALGKTIYIANNLGTDDCNVSIAEANNWTVQKTPKETNNDDPIWF